MDFRFKKHLVATTIIFTLSSHSVQATEYTLEWKIGTDEVIANFNGTANGNMITNISNASVFFDGVAFNGNGSLFVDSLNSADSAYLSTGAQVSFDGTQNNFVFTNSDFSSANYTYTNYFQSDTQFSINTNQVAIGHLVNGVFTANPPASQPININGFSYSGYSVAPSSVPVPAAVWLFGSTLAGLIGFNRKKSV